jgi:phage/plasmid primase-like uncharacterized protein
MKSFILAGVAVLGLFVGTSSVRAEDKTIHGVLVDNHCSAKMMKADDPDKAAAEHEKACCKKCGKDAGYAVISGKKIYKLDDKGNEMATKYLDDKDNTTMVTVKGDLDGDTLKVASIDADKDAKKSDEKKDEKKEG